MVEVGRGCCSTAPQRRAEGFLTLLSAKKGAPASVANAVKQSWGGLWEAAGSLHRSEHISAVHVCHLYTPAHMKNSCRADAEGAVRIRILNISFVTKLRFFSELLLTYLILTRSASFSTGLLSTILLFHFLYNIGQGSGLAIWGVKK